MDVSKDLTELVEIDPHRVDGVKTPASGFPFLVIKAVNASGQVNEKPDIAAAEKVLTLLAKLIQAEAEEMATGEWGEVCDIATLTDAARLMLCFRRNEQMGMDQGDSIAKELESAIADRANELGVKNPLTDPVSKETPAPAETAVNPAVSEPTITPEPAPVEKSADELVAEAVTKAVAPLAETIKGLEAELASMKAKPIPGGPAVTAVTKTANPANDGEAERFERLAKSVQDRELGRYYAERAKEARSGSRA